MTTRLRDRQAELETWMVEYDQALRSLLPILGLPRDRFVARMVCSSPRILGKDWEDETRARCIDAGVWPVIREHGRLYDFIAGGLRVQCKHVRLVYGPQLDLCHTHRDGVRDTYPVGAFDLLAYRDPNSGREWFIPEDKLRGEGDCLLKRFPEKEAEPWLDRIDLLIGIEGSKWGGTPPHLAIYSSSSGSGRYASGST